MNQGQLSIKMGAHVGAQKAAESLVDSYNYNASKMQKRKYVLDYLEEAGFGRFLIDASDDGDNRPKAITGGKRDEGESWTYWALFNKAEVEAYVDAREENDDTPIVRSGEQCPDPECGGYVYLSREYGCTRCDQCRELYCARENEAILNKCEAMFGGASYSGPGRPFNEDAYAVVKGSHILVTQSGGWDV